MDLNRGSVCAEYFSLQTILMAAFCFLNRLLVIDGELQPQI
jgi:hypothetical protein